MILKDFAEKKADILIGTQMIVKGHDFPAVSLIGVVLADLSLYSSTYKSSEETFQLISQAVGRAGRADIPGKAVIQTYQPDDFAIVTASSQDYESFYNEESTYRMLMDYPPYKEMLGIICTGSSEQKTEAALSHIASLIRKIDGKDRLHTIGPAFMPVKKIRDKYRAAVYLRSDNHKVLLEVCDRVKAYIDVNKGFKDLDISYDFNI